MAATVTRLADRRPNRTQINWGFVATIAAALAFWAIIIFALLAVTR